MTGVLSANSITTFMVISTSLIMWIVLVAVCLASIVFIIIMILKFSKNPDKWMDEKSPDDESYPGTMRELSDTIRSDKMLKEYSSSIKNAMQMMFFQKIENTKNITTEEIVDIKNNNSQQLYEIINDDELANWIVKVNKGKSDKNKSVIRINKQKYVKEINSVLEKMEAWGE